VRTIERMRSSKHCQDSSRVAAGYESPARKCRVKWEEIGESRRDDTRSHAHSSSRAAKFHRITPALAPEGPRRPFH
jgi:hypothetical protein